MSDPVTNAEIEDVLSAVRRLVSGAPSQRDGAPRAEPQGKLVLTPAFRVDTKEQTAEASADDTVPEAPFTDEDFGDDADPFVPRDNITSIVQETLTESSGPSEVSETPEATPEFDGIPGIEVTLQDEDAPAGLNEGGGDMPASLEARIAELEAVVVEAPDHAFEPAEVETSDPPSEILFHHSEPETAEQDAAEPDAAERDRADDLSDDDHVIESIMAAEAAPELSAADWQDAPETPYEGYDEQYDEADPIGEDVTLEAGAYVRHDEAPTYAAEPGSETADGEEDDMVIDEAMLREIVARLVREELQGTMGERITRNLRRMVRREIARALALKEFE